LQILGPLAALAGVLLAVLGAPADAKAHGAEFTGNYVALGPTVGTASYDGQRAPHVGAELSVGKIGGAIGFGGWLDYQKAFGALGHNRIGAGLQIATGMIGLLGVDAGFLLVDAGSAHWHTGMRARVFLSAGWLSVTAGGGVVDDLGRFTEVTVMAKLPFSCDILGAIPWPCDWHRKTRRRAWRNDESDRGCCCKQDQD
jgi:hypothetical protein